MAIAGKGDPLPPRDPQYVSRSLDEAMAGRGVRWPLFGGFMMRRRSQTLGDWTFQQQVVGGDWNHGLFYDCPIILGMENHPN